MNKISAIIGRAVRTFGRIANLMHAAKTYGTAMLPCPNGNQVQQAYCLGYNASSLNAGPKTDRRSTNDDPLNSALNYGYAIVRAMVARAAVTTGFIPAFGIHHRSQLNAFNLADDLVEPFRPVVDLVAVGVFGSSVTLSASQRADLRRVLHAAVAIDNFSDASVIDAIDVLVDSLKAALERSDESILRLLVVKAIS